MRQPLKGGGLMKSLIPWKKRDQEMVDFRKNFDDLVDRFFSEPVFSIPKLFSEKNWYPNVDVSEDKRDIVVKAEIPGVDKEDIDLSLDGRFLTIRGEKKHEKEESDEHYHRVESSFGFYKRTIELPADVDESKVDAKYKNGVLKIKLRKAKESETKKIEIKTGK
jgi:HSP20 family protein